MDCNWLFNIVYKGALGEERSKFLSYNIVENDVEISRVMRVVKDTAIKRDIVKIDYIEHLLPAYSELEKMLEDIVEFYCNNFEFEADSVLHEINVRLFVEKASGNAKGDQGSNAISISCPDILNGLLDKPCYRGRSVADKISNAPDFDRELFKCSLAFVAAHEFYHFFHEQDFKKKYKEVKSLPKSELIADIMAEILADYFAYSYFEYKSKKLSEVYGQDHIDLLKNYVLDSRNCALCFGIGRKELLPKHYTEDEVQADKQLVAEKKSCGNFAEDLKNYPGVTVVDYSGGYVLDYVSRKKNLSQGNTNKVYTKMYTAYLAKDYESALYEMLLLGEQYRQIVLNVKE